MPTLNVPSNGIQFFFTDSGPLSSVKDYTTYIIVHGHTYHGGVFQRLLPLAAARSVRLICINRREYPGSTPHTAEELRVYAQGSDEERATLLSVAGINLALCVNEIIQQCDLPSAGGVALVGWSLGNSFTLAAMASITSLPSSPRARLQAFVKTIIIWDAPLLALGIKNPPNAYVPLHDPDLAPEARGPAFGEWVQAYFTHGDLSSHDAAQLNYRTPDPSRQPTFHDLSQDQLLAIVDFSVGAKCDTIIMEAPFASALSAIVDKALFDPDIRAAWPGTRVVCMYGVANPWNVHFAVWDMEERVKEADGTAPIVFHPIAGANHFIMWDEPRKALDALLGCTTV
ncbi:Alpha/Beta hydrolase protein [Mycena polygramma]|nr:Alpha/Beta hydrolase protein [Mycena polygramma]